MSIIRPHPGAQEKFLSTPADIAIYGGAAGGGKSFALLAEGLRHIGNKHFGAVIFRRTSPQITSEGGLWDESMKIYPQCGGEPSHTLDWTFASGANIGFRHLQYENDKLAWQGAQVPLLGFDELTHFTESQFFYLLSRNRSTCGIRPYVRATTNPVSEDDPIGGWVNRLVSWWIDPDTGYSIPERSGVVRWFIRQQGQLVWGDSKEELQSRYGGIKDIMPKSLTFIHASLDDNPTLTKNDPDYRANLLALPLVEQMRLLGGNWKVKLQAGLFYKIEKIEIVDEVPPMLGQCRGWDLAATQGAGDWTAGVKVGKGYDGTFYILDSIVGQWETGTRDGRIRQTAQCDGQVCHQRFPQDPGQAGKSQIHNFARTFAGMNWSADTVSGKKTTRASGLASEVNCGNVKMLAGDWNRRLLERFDMFPTDGVPDDEIDAAADGFNWLANASIIYDDEPDHAYA
jgi:predicted phage terminase large subunit-like protein